MQTNFTKQLAERNWERKYGTISTIIVSILLVIFITTLWPKN